MDHLILKMAKRLPRPVKESIKFVRDKVVKNCIDFLAEPGCLYYLTHVPQNHNKKIRVGFLVQVYGVWDKQEPIYDEMKSRESFEPILIAVPPHEIYQQGFKACYDGNPFLEKYPNVIKAMDSNGNVVPLQDLKLDYVFYQRPYDEHMPKKLRTDVLRKYTKCCYVPYGYNASAAFYALNTDRRHFRNFYFIFNEDDRMRDLFSQKFKLSFKRDYRHAESLGYPSVEPFILNNHSTGVNTILWTPRWSEQETNFFKYKDFFLNINDYYPSLHLIFRPHGLLFTELQAKNLMTDEEISAYLAKLEKDGNEYDHLTPLLPCMEAADVMITDFSSMIINFFVTGKPMIFCDKGIELAGICAEAKSYMYIAKGEADIRKHLDDLIAGRDPLREGRIQFIRQHFGNYRGSAKRIVDRIEEDYCDSQKDN